MAKKIIKWFDSTEGKQPNVGDEIVVYYSNSHGQKKKEIITWTFYIAAMTLKQETKFKWILLPETL